MPGEATSRSASNKIDEMYTITAPGWSKVFRRGRSHFSLAALLLHEAKE